MAYTPENPVSIAFTSGGYTPSQPVNFDFSYSSNYLQVTEQSVDTIQIIGGKDFTFFGQTAYTAPSGSSVDFSWGPSGRIGTLSATESGSDTASISGFLNPIGNLAVVESGSDSVAASGQVIVTGILSHTEEAVDTLTSSGTVLIQGDLASTEQTNDVFLATSLIDYGDLAATESGSDTFAATGYRVPKGDLLATEVGDDVLTINGVVIIQGSLIASDSSTDIFSATGFIPTVGNLASTESGVDTFVSTGFVSVTGNLSSSESSTDALSFAGQVLVQGEFAVSEVEMDRFLTTANGTRVGSMHSTESEVDVFYSLGYGLDETVTRYLGWHSKQSSNEDVVVRQLVYTNDAEGLATVGGPFDPESGLQQEDPVKDLILAARNELLLSWYKDEIDRTYTNQFHPYDRMVIGETSADGYIPEPGSTVDVSTLVGLTESTTDKFSATGTVLGDNYDKPVIVEIRDYVTDLPITAVTVTLAVDGTNKTVTNGVAYLGTVTTGTHTVLASATGYHATNADTIANDSFTL